MTEPRSPKKRKPLTQKQACRKRIVSGIALALIGFATFRVVTGNRNPEMTIVWPATPPDNAFSTCISASHNVTLHSKGFNEAYDAVIGRRDASKEPLPVSLDQFVSQNHASLQTLRRDGFTHPFQIPPSTALMDNTEYLSDFRNMARLLVIEGDVRAKQGNLRGAIDSNLDAVRFGQETTRNGILVHYLSGIACQRIGQRGLWRQLKSYSADDARYAIRCLEELSRHQPPLSESLEAEKRYGQTELCALFLTPEAYFDKSAESKAEPRPNAFVRWLIYKRSPLYAVWSKQKIWDNYTGYLDSHIRQSRKQYDPNVIEIPVPNDIFSRIFAPVFLSATFKEVDFTAERKLLIVSLAIQAYQKEHGGRPPATLAELAPDYLTAIPEDPFAPAPNTPLRYRKGDGANEFVLYSVGPNGKDDNGTRINNHRLLKDLAPGEKRADFVLAGSEGDMVAGLNF